MSNWKDATTPELPTCAHCGEQRLVEQINGWYYCQVCSWRWPVNPLAPMTAPRVKG